MYKSLRVIHLVLASLSLPFLLMYGISAVQMAHGTWFTLKPTVRESDFGLPPGLADARAVARAVTAREPRVRGEVTNIKPGAREISLRLILPGTVHEVRYQRESGQVHLKTSVAGVMGMLNRLHHAAGLWHEPLALRLWGWAVAVVSAALLLVGGTGMAMWFLRRSERRLGALLLALNLAVVMVLLGIMRHAGP